MNEATYRKLNVDLPVQPITNERPWFVIGLLFALTLILYIAYAYLRSKRLL